MKQTLAWHFVSVQILNIGKSINFIRHVCQDRSVIMGGGEKALQTAGHTSGESLTGCFMNRTNKTFVQVQ